MNERQQSHGQDTAIIVAGRTLTKGEVLDTAGKSKAFRGPAAQGVTTVEVCRHFRNVTYFGNGCQDKASCVMLHLAADQVNEVQLSELAQIGERAGMPPAAAGAGRARAFSRADITHFRFHNRESLGIVLPKLRSMLHNVQKIAESERAHPGVSLLPQDDAQLTRAMTALRVNDDDDATAAAAVDTAAIGDLPVIAIDPPNCKLHDDAFSCGVVPGSYDAAQQTVKVRFVALVVDFVDAAIAAGVLTREALKQVAQLTVDHYLADPVRLWNLPRDVSFGLQQGHKTTALAATQDYMLELRTLRIVEACGDAVLSVVQTSVDAVLEYSYVQSVVADALRERSRDATRQLLVGDRHGGVAAQHSRSIILATLVSAHINESLGIPTKTTLRHKLDLRVPLGDEAIKDDRKLLSFTQLSVESRMANADAGSQIVGAAKRLISTAAAAKLPAEEQLTWAMGKKFTAEQRRLLIAVAAAQFPEGGGPPPAFETMAADELDRWLCAHVGYDSIHLVGGLDYELQVRADWELRRSTGNVEPLSEGGVECTKPLRSLISFYHQLRVLQAIDATSKLAPRRREVLSWLPPPVEIARQLTAKGQSMDRSQRTRQGEIWRALGALVPSFLTAHHAVIREVRPNNQVEVAVLRHFVDGPNGGLLTVRFPADHPALQRQGEQLPIGSLVNVLVRADESIALVAHVHPALPSPYAVPQN